ncbi:putative lysogenization regulator [Alcanivorax hongdengensis A-11-3]|uniref:High frequency lysogenization protein HflD homolog n=1 Tax=Alcanivorax hongdengensis A-11-3 TaxID=1177179 RepID=L0W9J2_9GAMM|nr:high frequency lysogenization protein HflD [Alcanivorax hongdengensis]EKF73631.1 putative lysogenization regulator [Alcanivorax hongdengensis A-11-3]
MTTELTPQLTPQQQQLLALAAVFEAAQLADDIASRGDCDRRALRSLLEGVMAMDATEFQAIYPQPAMLREGLSLLNRSLGKEANGPHMRPLNYGLALLHLSGKLRKQSDTISILRHRLLALSGQQAHFDDITDDAFCHRLAGIYLDTLGTFRFRIQVRGEPAHLQDEDKAARIRALFLAGVRAAFLWHQLGGRRWHLLFQRKRLIDAIESININDL